MEPRNVIVLTPPGAPDPALAIAASRAGANGVLDLEYANDWHEVSSAIERLTRFGGSGYGLLLRPDQVSD